MTIYHPSDRRSRETTQIGNKWFLDLPSYHNILFGHVQVNHSTHLTFNL